MKKLTRSKRISKLANAIKAYRGLHTEGTDNWLIHPKPSKNADVVYWLNQLGLVTSATQE